MQQVKQVLEQSRCVGLNKFVCQATTIFYEQLFMELNLGTDFELANLEARIKKKIAQNWLQVCQKHRARAQTNKKLLSLFDAAHCRLAPNDMSLVYAVQPSYQNIPQLTPLAIYQQIKVVLNKGLSDPTSSGVKESLTSTADQGKGGELRVPLSDLVKLQLAKNWRPSKSSLALVEEIIGNILK